MKEKEIELFKEEHPSRETYWRAIILFGSNVASYKFALGKSLIELAAEGKDSVTLEELAVPYSKHICEHLKTAPKQITSRSSQFLEACHKYNKNEINFADLLHVTEKKGFINVIDAFHVVNQENVGINFFEKDYTRGSKKIHLTDDVFLLQQQEEGINFLNEIESRWNLVETAWELNISRNLIDVSYDGERKILLVKDKLRRKDVTSARSALNGYQKGKCFYCFDDISLDPFSDKFCDVDHFYPWSLELIPHKGELNLNGVWNLVLACPACNRGGDGKFAKVPATAYVERLHKRNEFFIGSHHPLRETLKRQTGNTREERIQFLQTMDQFAYSRLLNRWETVTRGDIIF